MMHHTYDAITNKCRFCGKQKTVLVNPDEMCPGKASSASIAMDASAPKRKIRLTHNRA